MSAISNSTSTQPVQNIESTEVVERADAATIEKTNELCLELFQQLMQGLGISSLDGYEVTQWTDDESIVIMEKNERGEEFCFIVVTDEEPTEEVASTPVIEEVDESEAPVAVAADAILESIPVAC